MYTPPRLIVLAPFTCSLKYAAIALLSSSLSSQPFGPVLAEDGRILRVDDPAHSPRLGFRFVPLVKSKGSFDRMHERPACRYHRGGLTWSVISRVS
ncbi:hypothetical protein PF010_g16496 [Phytophthora fragariae]|uniref:Uncharacterized protein n=1 Tax=Phytophthora fragariae TaxID=53985 RepID=A0A6A3JMZ3_9STRA|nr:hypothetical protein PF011_g15945 [Phytophthora fragariae]KAE9096007.1 hypothetical protein PF010_g16496 [Phytophthora fragariae]KAE9211386.1 hypothetical protein PF004_g15934 [Phytophthora fragariae]KAE9329296.1 hypothetical protein PF008_g15981 [Phytophthora fragariae]